MDTPIEDILLNGSEEELNELKRFLFQENIRLTVKMKELNELQNKFLKEKLQFQDEMKTINMRIVNERKRLKDEELFFDKKMEILKSGFEQLESDKRKFEIEKNAYENSRNDASNRYFNDFSYSDSLDLKNTLFAGVNNPLALKKRYRDLLKIFHPDNLCGDTEVVSYINKEYERIKKEIDYPFKSVK